MDLAPDFDEFCALLIDERVEFLVIGAYALAFHGAPRFTGDLGLLINPSIEQGRRLLTVIERFGFPTDALSPEDIADGNKVIEMGVPPVQLHLMSMIDGVTWSEAWATRERGPLGRHEVDFIGRETLITNKRASGRPKDLADVAALEGAE